MSSRIDDTPRNVVARLAVALFFALGILCSAYAAEQISLTAKSGEPKGCYHVCDHWRVDANGKEWPVKIQYTAQPANGTVRTQVRVEPKTLRNGEVRNVRLAHAVYQSRKGFIGQDSFTYRRIRSKSVV